MCYILHWKRLYYILCRCGEEGENGEGTIFLVLLEAAAQATNYGQFLVSVKTWDGKVLFFGNPITGHALPRFRYLSQHILPSKISNTNDPKAYGKVGSVAPQPSPGR
jgi:hypothetical protein